MAEPELWGVSVDDVSSLAPHIAITNSDTPPALPPVSDPYNASTIRKITSAQVEAMIHDVGSMVDVRLFKRHRVRNDAFMTAITEGMKDIITNGAGSYLVAAAFPVKAGVNENTSYSAELWRRYKEALEALEKALDKFIKDGVDVEPIPGAAGRVAGFFPAPAFRDDMRW